MIAEFGQILLILALFVALYQGVFPMAGAHRGDLALMAAARPAAAAQALLVAAAFAALTYLHATDDFSVRNVAEHSHTEKPFIYKLAGVWGNHEGSMLLWVLILALYGGALALRARMSPLRARTLAVQGLIAAAFLAFLIFASNPFARLDPAPVDGADLNPLLQDPGLVLHPPFLYLGYVGFSIAFAFAAAGLIGGRIDEDWAREARPWTLAAWTFMTIGIALGSWWAYYELGWGGFWAWDPVENASFMPWLAGAALIHAMKGLEVRGAFRAWTALLAILAFSLSLIGTFLVRSGILTSVHAFAVDPTRGVFILAILVAAIGGALTLFAARGPALRGAARFQPVSRESGLLLNNVVLTVSCATVFLGTFYPLMVEVMGGGKISVGAPYFNLVFTPFMALLLLVIAPASALAWKRGDLPATIIRLGPAAGAGVAASFIAFALTAPKSAFAAAGAGLAIFAVIGTLHDALRRVRPFSRGAAARAGALPKSYVAMCLAHLGFAVVAFGVIGAGVWKSETIAYVPEGSSIAVGGFEARLKSVRREEGPNFESDVALFEVGAKPGRAPTTLRAEKRFYPVRGMQTTEAAIATDLGGDLYLTLGDYNPEKGWAVRAWRHPFAAFMWAGAGLIALGGAIGAAPATRRRRAAAVSTVHGATA